MAHLSIQFIVFDLPQTEKKKNLVKKSEIISSNTNEKQYLFLGYLFNYDVKVSTLGFEDNIAMNNKSLIFNLFYSGISTLSHFTFVTLQLIIQKTVKLSDCVFHCFLDFSDLPTIQERIES